MLIVGRGGLMSSLDIPRLVVPLANRVGTIDLQIALEKAERRVAEAQLTG